MTGLVPSASAEHEASRSPGRLIRQFSFKNHLRLHYLNVLADESNL